jgi:flagellar basal-body rod protein FlgG
MKDAQNRLVTSMGYPVADFTIDSTATAINVSLSGEVTVTLPGQTTPQNAGTISIVRFDNPAGLSVLSLSSAGAAFTGLPVSLIEDPIYIETAASGAPQEGSPNDGGRGGLTLSSTEAQRALLATESPFDLAIDGHGFFRVALGNGLVGYTRDGHFTKDLNNRLVTSMGYPVADFTIDPTATGINIAPSGEVTVTLPGPAEPQTAGTINTVTFANPGGLSAIGDNLFIETAFSGAPQTGAPNANGRGALKQFYIEVPTVYLDKVYSAELFAFQDKTISAADLRDLLPPSVAITVDKSYLKTGETATVTFTLSQSVIDFGSNDVTVDGGSLKDFKGSGTSYSAAFVPLGLWVGGGLRGVGLVEAEKKARADFAAN